MFLDSRILFIYTETSLHAGTGSGLGAVDLPIQRERTTAYPMVHASGLKGALRSEAEDRPEKVPIFGPELVQATEASQTVSLHAGAISPGDAQILLFPVRSLTGVFAWTTSMLALHRFRRDAREIGLGLPEFPLEEPAVNQAYVSGSGVAAQGKIVLEEFAFSVAGNSEENERTANIARTLADIALPQEDVYDYWRTKLRDSLVVLPDDAFRDFVLNATEIITRVRLEPDTKTVMSGALWTEEHLPADSLLYAPVRASRLRMHDPQAAGWPEAALEQAQAVLNWVSDPDNIPHRFQLGANETVGRGMVHVRWTGGAA